MEEISIVNNNSEEIISGEDIEFVLSNIHALENRLHSFKADFTEGKFHTMQEV
jgi:hypothetical protein